MDSDFDQMVQYTTCDTNCTGHTPMCSDENELKCPNIPCPEGSAQSCNSSWQPVMCPIQPLQLLCCRVTMLIPGTKYEIKVRALSDAGSGNFSEVITNDTAVIGKLNTH